MAKPSRPLLIAPAIPLWGVLAFFGTEQLAGTAYFAPFLAVMAIAFVGLFWYVVRQTMAARHRRRAGKERIR